jgi:hypothetical protein
VSGDRLLLECKGTIALQGNCRDQNRFVPNSHPGDCAVANATIKILTLNLRKDKCSHITIAAGAKPFTTTTDVSSVTDAANGLTWGHKVTVRSTSKLKVQLKGTRVPSSRRDVPPDSGTVTVTLNDPTAPPPTVDPAPAEYVCDDES